MLGKLGLKNSLLLGGGLLAAVVLGGFWLHYQSVLDRNEQLVVQVRELTEYRRQADKTLIAVGEQLVEAENRAKFSQSIKEEIYEIAPSGVPADIRVTLERLRDH